MNQSIALTSLKSQTKVMKKGDIALANLQQADGQRKLRPVLLLKQMAPFQDWLVCGISSQLRQAVSGLDEVIRTTDDAFLKVD